MIFVKIINLFQLENILQTSKAQTHVVQEVPVTDLISFHFEIWQYNILNLNLVISPCLRPSLSEFGSKLRAYTDNQVFVVDIRCAHNATTRRLTDSEQQSSCCSKSIIRRASKQAELSGCDSDQAVIQIAHIESHYQSLQVRLMNHPWPASGSLEKA